MIALLIFLGLLGFMVWAIRSDNRDTNRRHAELQATGEAWLKEHLALPRYRVKVLTKARNAYYSKDFEPSFKLEYWFQGWHLDTHSSLGQAERMIEGSIKSDRYYHREGNLFIPMCEIESLQAVAEEGHCDHGNDEEDGLPRSGAV